ncbi:MAG TPA: hypothetical protein PKG65_15235, partial [Ferruginibacter sp.]|nr:hypothetical protein [Ferruginibacter sp.]
RRLPLPVTHELVDGLGLHRCLDCLLCGRVLLDLDLAALLGLGLRRLLGLRRDDLAGVVAFDGDEAVLRVPDQVRRGLLLKAAGLQGVGEFGDGLAGSGDAVAPTPVDNDNSGVLQYVRIEYAGYAFQPDKEVNSLTLACVGSGTTIDHIQVTYAKDDAYEWFGGSVNCKYLIAWKTQDDDFDTDNGYSGKVQFGLVIRDSLIADISTSEAFESDNNATGTTATPKTRAIFSNITAIGPRATLNNAGNTLFRAGAQIRRNSAISIFNSIIMGWPQGILIDATTGTSTALNIEDSSLRLRNVTLAGNTVNLKFSGTPGATITSDATLNSWFTGSYYNNDLLTNVSDAKLIQPYNYSAPDPTPFAGSNGNQKILTGGSFTDAKFAGDTFFDQTATFRGAIAPAGALSTWWKGWTKFN